MDNVAESQLLWGLRCDKVTIMVFKWKGCLMNVYFHSYIPIYLYLWHTLISFINMSVFQILLGMPSISSTKKFPHFLFFSPTYSPQVLSSVIFYIFLIYWLKISDLDPVILLLFIPPSLKRSTSVGPGICLLFLWLLPDVLSFYEMEGVWQDGHS